MPEIKPSQWDEESGEKEEDGEKASQSIATKEKKVESQARVTKAKRPKAQAEGLRDTLTCKQSWWKAQWASKGWARAGHGKPHEHYSNKLTQLFSMLLGM